MKMNTQQQSSNLFMAALAVAFLGVACIGPLHRAERMTGVDARELDPPPPGWSRNSVTTDTGPPLSSIGQSFTNPASTGEWFEITHYKGKIRLGGGGTITLSGEPVQRYYRPPLPDEEFAQLTLVWEEDSGSVQLWGRFTGRLLTEELLISVAEQLLADA